MTFTWADARAEGPGDLAVDEKTGVLENRFYRVAVDPRRGALRSILDKRANRELVDASADRGFGQILVERFCRKDVDRYQADYVKMKQKWAVDDFCKPGLDPDVPYRTATPGEMNAAFDRGPVSTAVRMTVDARGTAGFRLGFEIVLCAGRPWIDLIYRIDEKVPEPWPEAAWVCLPVKASAPKFRLGRLGAVVDPAAEFLKGTNLDASCIESGVAIVDGGFGVGICPIESPLVCLDRPGLFRYSRDFVPRKPVVFVNLFNNQWPTNFQQWIGGSWTSRIRIWSAGGYADGPGLVEPADAARNPLLDAAADGPAGPLPARQAGLALSRRGVRVRPSDPIRTDRVSSCGSGSSPGRTAPAR